MSGYPHVDRANRYARDVVEGRILACKWARLACQRHLGDLAAAEADPEYPFAFDPEKAARVCAFVELLPHTAGKWARERRKLVLEPWQCFMTAVLFGWIRRDDGLRRFRRAYIAVPRKNGKSSWVAAIALYMLGADGEQGAQVFCGATSRDQAFEVFRPARAMADSGAGAAYRSACGVVVGAQSLFIPANGSFFKPLIGKPGDGASPSCAIIDEYHEHPTAEQFDTMWTGMGAREQPLLLVITTAGSDIASPCALLQQDAQKVLEGVVRDEQLFAVVYTIDEGDDWTDEAALSKANPNLGVSVFREQLRADQETAVRSPEKAAIFKTKRLNVWVQARSPWMNMEAWARCQRDVAAEEFAGEECWGGMDLAAKVDIASVANVFSREEDDGWRHYYAFCRHYLPENRAQAPEAQHYQAWVEGGHLIPTPGDIIDQGRIQSDILGDAARFSYAGFGYDQYGATKLAVELQEEGVPMVEVAMNVRHLSEPMKWIDALVQAGRFHHDGDPVLAWMMSNVTVKPDANENIFPRKETPKNKIDGAVAVIIAMSRALAAEPVEPESVYNDRGITWL